MEHHRRQYATTRSLAGSRRASMSLSPEDSMWAPPLKRSRTSQQPTGSAHMYQSFSTPSGASFGTPFPYPLNPSLLASVAEQSSFPTASFPGPQTRASVQPASHFGAGRQSVPVLEDSGMNPSEFLQARGYHSTRPLPADFPVPSSLPSTTPAFSDLDQLQHHATAPSILSFGSMTDAMTLETNSIRQVGDPYDGPGLSFHMAPSSSQTSFLESPVYEGGVNLFEKSSANDMDLRYTGSMHPSNLLLSTLNGNVPQALPYMGRSESSQSLGTVDLSMSTLLSQPLVDSLAQPQFMAEDMSRAPSNTSARSTASRAKSVLRRHLDNGKTPLQPKASPSEADTLSMLPSQADVANKKPDPTVRADTPQGGGSSCSMAGRRIDPVRTRQDQQHKTPRLFCKYCKKHPAGFRGDHELRRHMMNKHSDAPKRWICCDPRDNDKTSSYTPYQSLSSCRKCIEGRPYAQDYNAAEHLRRVHFTPKAQRKGSASRSKQGSHRNSTGIQRRPDDQLMIPMEELKKWMKEIDVSADAQATSAANDQGNSEDHGFGTSDNVGDDDSTAPHGQGGGHSTSHGAGHGTSCDSGYRHGSGDTGGYQHMISPISAYQSPTISPWYPKGIVADTMGANDCSPAYDGTFPISGLRSTADMADVLFPAMYPYPYYDSRSPSETTSMPEPNNILGWDAEFEFANQHAALFDGIDTSF